MLTSALFPFIASSVRQRNQQQQGVEIESPESIGSLLDQDFIRCSEIYIEEAYNKAADTLNHMLHQNCGLEQQLKSLASIYLMLENDLMHSFCEALYIQQDNNENWFDVRTLNRTFAESSQVSGYNETVYIELESNANTRPKSQASYLEMIQFHIEVLQA